MTKQEILESINKNPAFFLATIDKDNPRVRGMLLYKADENGILFHTAVSKDLYSQVLKNTNAELCFNCSGTQIRISGQLEIVDDNNLKDEIYAHPSRAFLQAWKDDGSLGDPYTNLIVFRLKNGVAVTWTMSENFAKKTPIQL